MPLAEITAARHDVAIALAYATAANVTGEPLYRTARCFLHREAETRLLEAMALVRPLALRLKIFDAFRPVEAQALLWQACPDPRFVADPKQGSPHSRGVAVDVTLIDAAGAELPMGTPFDAFTPLSHHRSIEISPEAQRNRRLLLGLMTAAGWDFYGNEWWHYQLFDARRYPLLGDADAPAPML